MARYVKSLERLPEVEVIPYHRYGEVKYEMLDREYHLAGLRVPNHDKAARACDLIRSQGLRCQASH
jgi:pyruvate formate lyase activating enzyme